METQLYKSRILPSQCFLSILKFLLLEKSCLEILHEAIKMWLCKKNDAEPQSGDLTQRTELGSQTKSGQEIIFLYLLS